jgi:prophage antirepressor-like protein
MDVAEHIEDGHYRRTIGGYSREHCVELKAFDTLGRFKHCKFLTERGLYRYLLQSNRPKASAFQDYVFDLLTEQRKRDLDAARLEAKIAHSLATRITSQYQALILEKQRLAAEKQRFAAEKQRLAEENHAQGAKILNLGYKLQEATRPEGYHRCSDSVWTDYRDYCLERYNASEDRATPEPIRHFPEHIEEEIQDRYECGFFEQGCREAAYHMDGWYREQMVRSDYQVDVWAGKEYYQEDSRCEPEKVRGT